MKNILRALSILLTLSFVLAGCSGAGETPTTAATTPAATEGDVLTQRRTAVVDYMRSLISVLWRSTEDIDYVKTAGGEAPVKIVKGRLYRGLPYTQAGTSVEAFLDYSASKDSNGIYTISGLNAASLSGGSADSRISLDCSSAVWMSWNQVSTSISGSKTSTKTMVPANNYLRVGEYKADDSINDNTKITCEDNGTAVMYEAYSKLQMGDAVVHNNSGAGHVMMVSNNVVKDKDGKISGLQSYVTIIDQTSGNHRAEKKYYDETLKEDVYYIGNIDKVFSYQQLYQSGYLPITIKELIDPAPVDEEVVVDSVKTPSKDNILEGTFTTNHAIQCVTITITGADGKVVQEATCYNKRATLRNYDLKLFLTERKEVIRGTLDLESLVPGSYHCTHVCRTATGKELKMRDFDFKV